jgi:hypothetical protein
MTDTIIANKEDDPVGAQTGLPLAKRMEMFASTVTGVLIAGIDHRGRPQVSALDAVHFATAALGLAWSEDARKGLEAAAANPETCKDFHNRAMATVNARVAHHAQLDREDDLKAVAGLIPDPNSK